MRIAEWFMGNNKHRESISWETRRGNWQFQIDGVDPEAEDITFSKGGFQEGHGGGIGAQPFFIEGVREALDAKGEWWVDVSR